jgi:hypothetical protein
MEEIIAETLNINMRSQKVMWIDDDDDDTFIVQH